MVIWEVLFSAWTQDDTRAVFRIALGDIVPAALAQMTAYEPLFYGLGEDGAEPRNFQFKNDEVLALRQLKLPVAPAGRRLICEFTNTGQYTSVMTCMIVVSSIPKDIPDCLISV